MGSPATRINRNKKKYHDPNHPILEPLKPPNHTVDALGILKRTPTVREGMLQAVAQLVRQHDRVHDVDHAIALKHIGLSHLGHAALLSVRTTMLPSSVAVKLPPATVFKVALPPPILIAFLTSPLDIFPVTT